MIVVERGYKKGVEVKSFGALGHSGCVTDYGHLYVDSILFLWNLGNDHVRVHPNDSNAPAGESYP